MCFRFFSLDLTFTWLCSISHLPRLPGLFVRRLCGVSRQEHNIFSELLIGESAIFLPVFPFQHHLSTCRFWSSNFLLRYMPAEVKKSLWPWQSFGSANLNEPATQQWWSVSIYAQAILSRRGQKSCKISGLWVFIGAAHSWFFVFTSVFRMHCQEKESGIYYQWIDSPLL